MAILALVACGGGNQAGSSPSPATSADSSAVASAAPGSGEIASAAPQASGDTATPEPTPTPNLNLLSYVNGTRLVAYPALLDSDPDSVATNNSLSFKDGAAGPFVFVFELPTVEQIDSFGFAFDGADTDPNRTATVAVSTTSASAGFSDVGTATTTAAPSTPVVKAGVKARWVRVTWNGPDEKLWEGVSAIGTLPGPRTGPAIAKNFVEHNHPYKGGKDDGADMSDDPWLVRTTVVGDGMTMLHCLSREPGDSSAGTLTDGRVFTYDNQHSPGRLVINDEGTEMVGEFADGPMHYNVTTQDPGYCNAPAQTRGGPNHILVLDTASPSQPYPMGDFAAQAKPYTFVRIPAAIVTQADLNNVSMVVLNGECDASEYISPAQGAMLNAFVAAGHKLAIYNADMCGQETHYDFLPYRFTTSNPGAGGAHGDRLIEVESDDLGSLDRTDTKRFLDATAYAKEDSNQIGDANTVTSKDDHWCGHLFGTNAKHVNGFMQMYAPYGKGVFIFGGFDLDDNNLSEYQKMRDLELGLTLPADLPCSVKVDMAFVLEPNRDATFTAGKAQTLPFDMEVLANQGWKGHINVATQGDFTTTVTPASFDLDGTTQALKLAVTIPSTTKAGTYAVTVTGADTTGKTSQAVIQFNGEAPLKKIPKKAQRIRLYGIHFDSASAKIQPRSEPVIKEIADLLKSDATLRFQVEGHTDSDGGAAYNLKLSQDRAQAVVNDLIHRYHIASSRLVPKGFGLTKPVASNATEGGKALNRRVELLRL